MKNAADFRAIARDALRGNWVIAVIVGLVASLLGGGGANSPSFSVKFDGGITNLEFAGHQIASFGGGHSGHHGIADAIVLPAIAIYAFVGALIFAALFFVLGSIIATGYSRFNLDLVDRQPLTFESLFAYFPQWKNIALTNLRRAVYVFLWSLLLVIPGIIASYSYALVPYLLAEAPDLSPKDAMERSRSMMQGNRMRLFCLHLSFIGWSILATLALGIGHLFLRPYTQAAEAAFYRDLCATWRSSTAESEPWN